jgi:hypothetical protein
MEHTLEQGASSEKAGERKSFPPFVQASYDQSDLLLALDGWVVEPVGEHKADWMTGMHYAELALKFAHDEKNPEFVTFVLMTMLTKSRESGIKPGGIEAGFVCRIARSAYAGVLN